VGSRTHGRGTFFVYSDKESTQRKRRPLQPVPEKTSGQPQLPTLPTGRLDQPSGLTNLNSPSMANCPYQSRKLRQVVEGGGKAKAKAYKHLLSIWLSSKKWIHY